MGNPLLAFWKNLFDATGDRRGRGPALRGRRGLGRAGLGHDLPDPAPDADAADRPDRHLRGERARADPHPGAGRSRAGPWRMGFFDAFYVMSYTASTIGFGEIPYPFTYSQRMWVTISIYLTVIGWAYAIGSLLALLQDRAFRSALAAAALQPQGAAAARALRADRRLRADRGAAGALARRAGPAVRRPRPDRTSGSTAWSWTPTTPTSRVWPPTPGIPGTSPSPGWTTPRCEAVVALTDDEEANLADRDGRRAAPPGCCPVIARVTSRTLAERMQAFGSPSHGQPVRPLRRPPAARAARPGVLPAADLAGERAGRRAARPRRCRRATAAGSSAGTAGWAGS